MENLKTCFYIISIRKFIYLLCKVSAHNFIEKVFPDTVGFPRNLKLKKKTQGKVNTLWSH